ncbi:hypothetical protein [Roseivirga echinicomitans]|uniref:Uncharacterized protein n=1 Tax=Roseivirga echinicomitans TaxID=296218 RepID=A0A150XUT0_9BACT|nr:hypothetical protein [Roseivirga echinicomitans]KYG82473.1 hypothetical protein AWN68_14560 [Roseivirga echinicomitans]
MNKYRKPFRGLIILLAAFLIFAVIYRVKYSMEEASPFEVNTPDLQARLLIATQGSVFKNKLVGGLVDSLRNESVYLEVRDISVLPEIDIEDWNAILVIHTWEYSKAPKEINLFASRAEAADHVLFFTTSGSGSSTIKRIDALSGASNTDQIHTYLDQILKVIKPLLDISPIDQSHINQ